MQSDEFQFASGGIGPGPQYGSARRGHFDWPRRIWRPLGTGVAILLALLLTWHVIHGKDGLSVWRQKRAEDRQLRNEIQGLEQENARLHQRVDRLKSDPDAIEHEAREKLHYAKPDEVIYSLPAPPPSQAQTTPPAN